MITYLDCMPCFFQQALDASRIAGSGIKLQKKVIKAVARELAKFPLDATPPVMGRKLHAIARRVSGKKDPYKKIKAWSNKIVLKMYPALKKKVVHSKNPLLTAVELAIAGNIIDFGLKTSLNVKKEVNKLLLAEKKIIKKEKKRLFNYAHFNRMLKRAKTILYIADNAGEIVFDRILIEEILKIYPDKKITLAVKSSPIINDALLEDAQQAGIEKLVPVIKSGTNAPGTVLKECNKDFIKKFKNADMVISKGMGNFEALNDEKKPIFFLFMVKCKVVAEYVNANLKDIILYAS